jgi:hypothetical protein
MWARRRVNSVAAALHADALHSMLFWRVKITKNSNAMVMRA